MWQLMFCVSVMCSALRRELYSFTAVLSQYFGEFNNV